MFLGVNVFDQEHITVASFSDLVNLFEAFAVDVKTTGTFEQSFYELEATSHLFITIMHMESFKATRINILLTHHIKLSKPDWLNRK